MSKKLIFGEEQLELIRNTTDSKFFVSGGYRSSKSVSILYIITQIMLHQPFTKALIGRKSYTDLRTDTLQILLNANDGLWVGLGNFNKAESTFYFKNGSIAFFKHFDDENSLKGPTTSLVYMEQAEEIKKSVWDVLKTRNSQWGNEDNPGSEYNKYIRRYGMSKKHIHEPRHFFFISCNPYPSWVYDVFVDENNVNYHLSSGYKKYSFPTTVNRHNLPKGYIEQQQAEMSEQEFQQYINGSWQFAEGRIYSEFSPEKHIVDPIDISKYPDAKLIASIDTGFQHYTGVLFTGLLADGSLIIYDEIYEKEMTTDDIARTIRIKEAQHGRKPDIYLLDYAANRTSAVSGKSEGDVFREHKIPVISADKEVYAGLMRGKSLMKQGKVKVSSVCKKFIKEIGLYVWNPKQPDKPLKKNDDLCLVGDTKVQMKDGFKQIKDVAVGDIVKSKNGYNRVLNSRMTNIDAVVYDVDFSDGSKISGTAGHPIYLANGEKKRIDALSYFDIIDTLKHVPVYVVGVKEVGHAKVFNIEVENDHNYYANGVLVSNCDPFRYIVNKCYKNPNFAVNAHSQMTSQQMMHGFMKEVLRPEAKPELDIKYGLI